MWAKHLFSQLYGQPDADNDVSPDTEGAELEEGHGTEKMESGSEQKTEEGEQVKEVQRISTRQWAENNDYNPQKLFHKVKMSSKVIDM